jgi:transcriptional regulator with XRE-family HTH domain
MSRPAPTPERVAEQRRLRLAAGAWLRRAREAAGLTQVELAERIGARYYTFISQIESGVGRVPIDGQRAWADALGIAPAEFARVLLRYYEPELSDLLFGAGAAPLEVAVRARQRG